MTLTLPQSLARSRELVDPALGEAVARLSPRVRGVAEYHLGFVDGDGRPAGGVGKALRPAVTLLTAQWAGGPAGPGVPGAVAVELVHNFSLLHDDIMDGDRQRRHRPTAWTVFGVGPAILAGDGLLALASRVLLDVAGPHALRANELVIDATLALIDGQGLDLAFEERPAVSVDECLAMSAGKTAALLSCAAAVGALLGDAPDDVIAGVGDFGYRLGLAFQAVDDVLGIWGQPSATGKPRWSDLRQRKKSLPIAAALRDGGAGGTRLATLLALPELDEADLAEAADLVAAAGGRDIATAEADRQLRLALDCLDALPLHGPTHEALDELARFVAAREL